VVLEQPRFGSLQYHELVFTPGRDYAGLELEYALLDERGNALKLDKMQVGPLFNKQRRLRANQQVVYRIQRPEDLIKVVGGPRPRSALAPPPLDLESIHSAQLRQALRCHQEEWVWQPGKMLPPEIDASEMPEPGTVFLRNLCPKNRPARDPTLQRSFRFRRRQDSQRGWIDLTAIYNVDYPQGVTYRVELLTDKGQPVLSCPLELRQPAVLQGTRSEYRIEITGAKAVQRAARVKRARLSKLISDAGGAREPQLSQVCQ
jgi:hypothetical protein